MDIGLLREIRDEDLTLMLQWRNAPDVRKNMYNTEEISLETHLAWWAKVVASDKFKYFMYENEGVPLGIVAFTDLNHKSRHSFWAFYASPNAPKGTGSRMEFLALDYAFNVLDLNKLSCEVLDYNPAVIKLHMKFGFKQEGLFEKHHWANERFCDVVRLAIFKDGWKMSRAIMLDKLMSYRK